MVPKVLKDRVYTTKDIVSFGFVAYFLKQSKTWKEAGMAKLRYSCGTCMGGFSISQKNMLGCLTGISQIQV